jgi:translation initiation factor IF-3
MVQRKFREKQESSLDKHVINEQIRAREVRVIGPTGEQLGVLPIQEARRVAEEAGLDLVEVAGDANPPVCRILDYGKLKYREQKKAAEARKRSTTHTVKELRVRYSTDSHDLDTKIRNARKFISEGDRVRFQMRFRGREAVYRDLGTEIFNKIAALLEDIASVEEQTPLIGNKMHLVLAPKGQAKQAS